MKINAIYFKNILYKESLGLEPLNEYEINIDKECSYNKNYERPYDLPI